MRIYTDALVTTNCSVLLDLQQLLFILLILTFSELHSLLCFSDRLLLFSPLNPTFVDSVSVFGPRVSRGFTKCPGVPLRSGLTLWTVYWSSLSPLTLIIMAPLPAHFQ